MGPLILLLLLLTPSPAPADSVAQATLTIIIDDLGNNPAQDRRAIALPGPVTYAILPHQRHSRVIAESAHRAGKETLLHMPMDNLHQHPLGPGALTAAQDQADFSLQFKNAIRSLPHISGVNNHMGSRLTQDASRMQWLMATLKQSPYYFVDSRTSPDTLAEIIAKKNNVPTLRRDVFLDHDPSPAAIDFQFKRLLELARRQGHAVAIGHPYPSTLGYLENVLPRLDERGYRLVTPSGLLLEQSMLEKTSEVESGVIQAQANKTSVTNGSQPCEITEQLKLTRVVCG